MLHRKRRQNPAMKTENFILPDSLSCERVIDEISKVYSIGQDAPRNKRQSYYDTFDWRLYKKGLVLFKEANAYYLNALKTDETVETVPWTVKTQPKFWWDFSEKPLQDKFQSILDVRALSLLVNIKKHTRSIRILNRDEKTVLRVHLEKVQFKNGQAYTPLIEIITLQPVRGYEEELRGFGQYLSNLGLTPDTRHAFLIALNAIGKKPGDYSSKPDIQLDPSLPAGQAAGRILQHLFHTMAQNEPGVKSDIDSEFLHDFRVSVRRTRSALSQIKGVFPAESVARFRRDFAYIGKLTNRLRDLDVYLLKQHHYRAMLSEHLRPGLHPLFEYLQSERRTELKKLVSALNGARYKKILSDWKAFLQSPETGCEEAKNSGRPAIALARKFIRKRHHKVRVAGANIGETTPDAELHKLRIECKKLRYLLEFFASLFPENEIKQIVDQLKKLQDNLGDFNDLSVQQAQLKAYLEETIPGNPETLRSAAAIGGLITTLYQKQQEKRQAFAQTFGDFSQPRYARIFHRLFGKT